MLDNLRRPVFDWLRRKASGSYIVGPELEDAITLAASLGGRGVSTAICFWDGKENSPSEVFKMHLETIRAIAHARLDSYLSIKAPALGFDATLVAELCHAGNSSRVRVHFDSLEADTVARTQRVIEKVHLSHSNLGCTLPGCWRRSVRDAEWATQLGLRVRVVKGQWRDSKAGDLDPAAGFLQVIDALTGSARVVAIATHDPVLARRAVSRLQRAGTACELELLFGLPCRSILQLNRELALPVRMYLPFGQSWLPYAMNQARRNPQILFWLMRDALLRNQASVAKSTVCQTEIA